jgi:glycosyltransferase involved in cell wall biosynthesis
MYYSSRQAERVKTHSMGTESVPDSCRILILSIVNPEVERNGAATVTRGFMKALSSPPLRAALDSIPVRSGPRKWHRLAQARSVLQSFVSDLPAKAVFLKSREFREKVKARLRRHKYDLIVLNGSDLLWISEFLPPSIPRILVAHNLEHVLFDCQIQNIGGIYRPLRGILRRDCKRLEKFEWKGIRQTENVIFLSSEEAAYTRAVCPDLRYTVMPPLFDYAPCRQPRRKASETLEIGFVGNFRWWPNQLGLNWFANQVLPHVNAPIRVNLFGRSDGLWRGDPRVVEQGIFESVDQIWDKCDLLICPSVSSGGVCVKLAEAAYNGMPVLANTHAARGLGMGDDPALIFLDKPAEWIEMLNSPAAREQSKRSVSWEIAKRFAVESHKDALQKFVEDVISDFV